MTGVALVNIRRVPQRTDAGTHGMVRQAYAPSWVVHTVDKDADAMQKLTTCTACGIWVGCLWVIDTESDGVWKVVH